MLDYDIDGMDDTKWHNFNVSEDVIVLNDVTVTRPSVDQEYGQTVTGGVGTGSQTTSGLHGPSIDASDLGYSFDGWGSRGMEYVYNLVQRFIGLFEMVNGGSQVEKIDNPQIMKLKSSAHNNDFEDVNYYPVIQGAFNDHGVIRTKNFRNHHGDIVSEGDTAGYREVRMQYDSNNKPRITKDTTIYLCPNETRKFFKNRK